MNTNTNAVKHTNASQSQSLEDLATFLDAKYQLPMGLKIGWDGIIGLIPGVGDLFTSVLSFYIILKAAALGCSKSVLLHMSLNVLIDNLISLVPFLGNIGDFFWKSNTKNITLLRRHLKNQAQTRNSSLVFVTLMLLTVLTLSILTIALGVWALMKLVELIF